MDRGYRISIFYLGGPEARFDWKHYMERHLPLAVGSPQRHCGLNHCDVDRPMREGTSKAVCICVVQFDSRESLDCFVQMFSNEHPDARVVTADQPAYTDIDPQFVVSGYLRVGDIAGAGYRLRVMASKGHTGAADLPATSLATLKMATGAQAVEFDKCFSGIPFGTMPLYTGLISLYFRHEGALADADRWLSSVPGVRCLQKVIGGSPGETQRLFSELKVFDLKLAISRA